MIKQIDEQEVVQSYKNGELTKNIAKKYGCSVGPIYRILHKHGVIRSFGEACSLAHKQGKFNDKYIKTRKRQISVEEMKCLYEKGHSLEEISTLAKIDHAAIHKIFKREGIILRSRKEAAKKSIEMGRHKTPWAPMENHIFWKGGRLKSNGYIMVKCPDHPRANSKGYVPEHTLVWEQANGRLLEPGEHVHHLNGVRDDNRPENLVALSSSEHGKETYDGMKEKLHEREVLRERIRELEKQLQGLKTNGNE
ncbi:MAG: HNH endonuclease signature motif containing protein [Bacillota bacterium]